MIRDKRQRNQTTVVEGPQSFQLREHYIDSSMSGGQGAPAIVAFLEEPRTGSSDRQSTQSPDTAGSYVPPYNAAIQDSRMTFSLFVETKFIPEHVEFKTLAGKTHYQAILKHLIAPELVNRFFDPEGIANARLRSVPEWPYLDNVHLCNLGSDHVHRLINAANAAGYSSQTVKHIKNVLFAIISHAQREGYFSGPNPASLVKLPKIVRKAQHNLTFEQTKAILQLLQYPAREIAIFAITTGMSLVEICDLRWKHVNLSDSECLVEGESLPALSLALRASWNRDSLGNSRPGRRNQIIEIREPLISTLRELKQRNPNPSGDNLVVISNKRGAILPSYILTSYLKKAGSALGLPWLTWQILRRARSSFVGEFLPQLSEPGRLRGTGIPARGSDSSDLLPVMGVFGNANDFDEYRHRRFCFRRRFRGPS